MDERILARLQPGWVAMSTRDQMTRTLQYTSRPPAEAEVWQTEVRRQMSRPLKLDDMLAPGGRVPLDASIVSSASCDTYIRQEVELSSTDGRRISAVLTTPQGGNGPFPGVVCIHGHGGDRHAVYDRASIYCGFATSLAERGVVTISTDVGQHEVYEQDRTLMGERLWDLIRCVDHLGSLPAVDGTRIGCAGLSLGGEMAMWLGAMDERIQATVSSGFLSRMDQMEQNHCMCWKFPGLRERVDYADVYSLIAPRALQCQNGLQEEPHGFTVPIAREALAEIQVIYDDFGRPENLVFVAHEGGHVVDLPNLTAFVEENL